MEAWRFGFDLPPAYKFDPTDADLVAHYLLPPAAGIRDPPYAHAVIDDDPCSCPPWELLRRHSHAGSDQAFFVGPGPPPPPPSSGGPSSLNGRGGRACRAVRGGPGRGVVGVWRGQKGVEADLVVSRGGGGAVMRLRFKRYNLTYYAAGERNASGWVMHEYHILRPKLRPGAVLSRIRITDRAKKERKKKQQAAAAAAAASASAKKAAPLGQDRPGPSNCLVGYRAAGNAAAAAAAVKKDARGPDRPGPSSYLVGNRAAGNAAAAAKKDARGPNRAAGSTAAVASGGEGTSSGAQSDVAHQGDDGDNGGGGGVGETAGGGYYTDLLNGGEGGRYYADDSNNYFNADRSGPSGSYLVYGRAAGNAAAPNDGGAGTFGAQSDVVHQGGGGVNGGGGGVGGTTGGYDTNFFNAGERHGCYVNDSYFNRGGGDIILPAN